MERLTKKYEGGMAYVSLNTVSALNDECVGLPITKLAAYEDLEEQGLLLKLPCNYGTTVYVIPKKENGLSEMAEMECLGFSVGEPCSVANLFSKNRFNKNVPKMYQPSFDNFGKTVFLTQAEAEEALKGMEGETK